MLPLPLPFLCRRCMSDVGNANQLALLRQMMYDSAADPETGAMISDGRMFKKAAVMPEDIHGTRK